MTNKKEANNRNLQNNNGKETNANMVPPPSSSLDEGPSPFVQQGVSRKNLAPAQVNYLDYTEHTFHVYVRQTQKINFQSKILFF